jgi:hypothetical protein
MSAAIKRIAHTGCDWEGGEWRIGGLTDELTDAALLGESPKRRAAKGASRKPEICVRYPRTIGEHPEPCWIGH